MRRAGLVLLSQKVAGYLSSESGMGRDASSDTMLGIIHLLGLYRADQLKLRRRLEGENLFLRHQLCIALRRAPQRLRLRNSDRALLVWMTRLWPYLLGLVR